VVSVDLRAGNYASGQRQRKFGEMLEKLRAIPGVHSASASNILPMCNCRGTIDVVVDRYTARSRADWTVLFNKVADHYFETLHTPILAGRDFNKHDTPNSSKVAIVNESMALKYFGAP